MNWKLTCFIGIFVAAFFALVDYRAGNMFGAKLQLIFVLAYMAGLLRISIKEGKKKLENKK